MARNLSEMLSNELEDESASEVTSRKRRHPLLIFRTAVVVVIAANRLRYYGHVGSKLFVSAACPGEIGGLSMVVAGGVPSYENNFTGKIMSK